jgi:mannose-6-phosphate isomerase-like protein (cupin superfamily)
LAPKESYKSREDTMARKFRRVVTGHDRNGKAIVIKDGTAENVKIRGAAGVAATLLWVTDRTPADLSGTEDAANREIGVAPPDGGTVFRIVEFQPQTAKGVPTEAAAIIKDMGVEQDPAKKRHPFMHRTRSIDYALVLSGRITMMLDEEDVLLEAGDVVVQRGTNHAWVNHGPEPSAVAFVLVDAKPLPGTKG